MAAEVPRRASRAATRVDFNDVDVRRLYEVEGWTAAEVAVHLGCATSTVYARLRGLGVLRRPARPRRSSRPSDTELRRLYLEGGLSLRQLAQRFSVSPQAVSGWLDAAGVPTRGPAPATPPASSDAMAALYHQGWSGLRIAARFGCSTATVYRRLEAGGVARRRPRFPGVAYHYRHFQDGIKVANFGVVDVLPRLPRDVRAPNIGTSSSGRLRSRDAPYRSAG